MIEAVVKSWVETGCVHKTYKILTEAFLMMTPQLLQYVSVRDKGSFPYSGSQTKLVTLGLKQF